MFLYVYVCVSITFFFPQGKNISQTQEGVGTHNIHLEGGKHFYIKRGGANIHKLRRETNIFTQVVEANIYFGGSGGYNDVDEEMHVSKENFLASKANIFVRKVLKLPAEARIFRVL